MKDLRNEFIKFKASTSMDRSIIWSLIQFLEAVTDTSDSWYSLDVHHVNVNFGNHRRLDITISNEELVINVISLYSEEERADHNNANGGVLGQLIVPFCITGSIKIRIEDYQIQNHVIDRIDEKTYAAIIEHTDVENFFKEIYQLINSRLNEVHKHFNELCNH